MEKVYRNFTNHRVIDLIPYIKEYVDNHKETEILVGCDSQNRGDATVYAVVVALYTPRKGAHVLYSKYTTPRLPVKRNVERLTNEVWASVEVAEQIKNELGIVVKWIDIDLNPDPKYGSNIAFTNAIGLVKGMGYNVRHKGNSPVMTYAADHLVK